MISVIIPNFNKGKFIPETILSVLNQSYLNFEIIFVDDSSTDNSLNEVNRFNDNRLRIVSNKTGRRGGSICRNLGLEKAIGEYVIFLDSDDLWKPFAI